MNLLLMYQKQFFETKKSIEESKIEWPFLFKRFFFFKYINFLMKIEMDMVDKNYSIMMPLVEVHLSAIKYTLIAENKELTKEMKIFEKILLFFAENSTGKQ